MKRAKGIEILEIEDVTLWENFFIKKSKKI